MTLRSPRTWLFALLVIALGVTIYLSDRSALWRGDLVTPATPTIVRKNGFDIHLVTLDEPTDVATLSATNVYLVTVQPSFGSFGQPLDRLFQEPSVAYYGYMYTQNKAGELEGQESNAFLEQFPGVFFASNAARILDDQTDHILSAFEVAHSVVLQRTDTPETDVAIGDRTYLLVLMSPTGTLHKPVAPLTCGNGAVDPGEQCDDGNEVDIDECTNECRTAFCGDGICSADEGTQCNQDVGACTGNFVCPQDCANTFHSSSSSSVSASSVSSAAAFCGNHIVDAGEQCDDGNQVSYDGCSPGCLFTPCDCPANADCVCVQPSSSSSSNVADCSEADCGLAPGIPNTTCPDGSIAGPICQRNEQGQCGWAIIDCPGSSSSTASAGSTPFCGDGVCTSGESPTPCTPPPEDPDACENYILTYCPEDCGTLSSSSSSSAISSSQAAGCGNGVCNQDNESGYPCEANAQNPNFCLTHTYCPQDCPAPKCGNSVCDGNEYGMTGVSPPSGSVYCPSDCGGGGSCTSCGGLTCTGNCSTGVCSGQCVAPP